jgi:hypothetical protein
MALVIEKNVPVVRLGKQGATINTLRIMEIGDSFAVPLGQAIATRANVYYVQKDTQLRFTARKVSADTLRVWRIADKVAA